MVDRLNYSNPEKVTALISFMSKNKNGVGLSRQHDWVMAKGSDGKWRIHGNQRVLHVQSQAYARFQTG